MTNTYNFAERELEILSKTWATAEGATPDDRPVILDFKNELLVLCERFGNSGQSGGSAPYVATELSQSLKKLCLQECISPITGIEEEWYNCTNMGATDIDSSGVWQNNRCGALFKDTSISNGDPYYLDAITWKTQTGSTWGGTANLKVPLSDLSPYLEGGTKWMVDKDGMVNFPVQSRQFIKEFPFTPKTFYIDVIETEVAPDDWEFQIKDTDQLDKVWKYYRKPLDL